MSSKFCSVVSSGTAALHLTAAALNFNKNDIVITSPITFLASSNSSLYLGAKIDFVDINNISYTLDPDLLERKIKKLLSNKKRIKAVVAVDYGGHPCHWKELRYLANKYNFILINDNCHALGAKYYNDFGYACKYADVVTQSFHPTKNITTGEGGAILTNSEKIYKKVNLLRNHGMQKSKNKNKGLWHYSMIELGFNYRITDFQCALGLSQLKRLNQFIKKRNNIAKVYDQSFMNNDKILIPIRNKNIFHAYHLYPLQIKFKKNKINKINFFNNLKKQGIILQVHYIPIHIQPYYKKLYNLKDNDFPNSMNFYNQQISLPIYPSLTKEMQNFVIRNILKNIN